MSLKILVCTVGGSPEPLVTSLEYHRPERVIYVASRDSRLTIRSSIEDALSFRLQDTQTLTLRNEQHLLDSVCDIRQGILHALESWNLDAFSPLLGDFTGGTKVMSAALVLAMAEHKVQFTYVGGNIRTKNGLGIVETGHERVLPLENPWDALAVRELQTIAHAFAHCQFNTVWNTARNLSQRADHKARFYKIFETLGLAYSLWDAFHYKKALPALGQVKSELEPFTLQQPGLKALWDQIADNQVFLERVYEDARKLLPSTAVQNTDNAVLPQGTGKSYLLDLVANARRRANLKRYDDAVARLYSIIEKTAKIRLRVAYSLDTSNLDCKKLPEDIRSKYATLENKEGKIQIPLQAAFQLLLSLKDPLGTLYAQEETTLRRHLGTRNHSLLAHGYNPVKKETYDAFFDIVLCFLEINVDDLPRFPTFCWDDLFF